MPVEILKGLRARLRSLGDTISDAMVVEAIEAVNKREHDYARAVHSLNEELERRMNEYSALYTTFNAKAEAAPTADIEDVVDVEALANKDVTDAYEALATGESALHDAGNFIARNEDAEAVDGEG